MDNGSAMKSVDYTDTQSRLAIFTSVYLPLSSPTPLFSLLSSFLVACPGIEEYMMHFWLFLEKEKTLKTIKVSIWV